MRKIIGLSLALVLTILVAAPAGANGLPEGSKADCKVNGGANWVIAAGEGINYVDVNARLDKDGEPTGKVHWRQVLGDDQNAKNWVADVVGIKAVGSQVRLYALTMDGTYFTVQIEDKGEPGAGVDEAWVKLGIIPGTNTPPPGGPVLIENGNYQVSCEVTPV